MQANGKIVTVGYAYDNGNPMFALARYNTDGSLDTTGFGTNGIVNTKIGNQSWANAVAIQTDGKIVVAGYSDDGSHYKFTLARYTTAGVLMLHLAAAAQIAMPPVL